MPGMLVMPAMTGSAGVRRVPSVGGMAGAGRAAAWVGRVHAVPALV
jgi:hypothetical protein